MTVATRYVNPFDQYIQANGLPYTGASLYFYQSGTSTPEPTYNDPALTIPNANPIILDSLGNPGNVFLLVGVSYRVVLIDTNGATVFDMDPVISFLPS